MSQRLLAAAFVGIVCLAWAGTAGGQTFYHDFWDTECRRVDELLLRLKPQPAEPGRLRHRRGGLSAAHESAPAVRLHGLSGAERRQFTLVLRHRSPPYAVEVSLAAWLTDKKAFDAVLYFRDATAQTCDPQAAHGTYLNSPITVLGFRVANNGPFVDRGTDANGNRLSSGYTGTGYGYDHALLDGGENAPAGWRMGRPTSYSPSPGVTWMRYSQAGDIGPAGPGCTPEFYRVSSVDSHYPGATVSVGTLPAFGTTGFGGFSTNPAGIAGNAFAFRWLVEKSDAMIVNSRTINEADCSGPDGGDEPQDAAYDVNFGEGWYAVKIDACLVYSMAYDPECKGLVFNSATVPTYLNQKIFGRDQGAFGVSARPLQPLPVDLRRLHRRLQQRRLRGRDRPAGTGAGIRLDERRPGLRPGVRQQLRWQHRCHRPAEPGVQFRRVPVRRSQGPAWRPGSPRRT